MCVLKLTSINITSMLVYSLHHGRHRLEVAPKGIQRMSGGGRDRPLDQVTLCTPPDAHLDPWEPFGELGGALQVAQVSARTSKSGFDRTSIN